MSSSKAIAEKIRRLRNERQNLLHEIEEVKKLADSEATALESEVSMLREELKIEKLEKQTYSKTTALEGEVGMLREELKIEKLEKQTYSKTTALESAISILREDLRMLREDLRILSVEIAPEEPEMEANPEKKPGERFFRHFFGGRCSDTPLRVVP